MRRIRASAGILIAVGLVGCGPEDDETQGLETGAHASDGSAAPLDGTTEDAGAQEVPGSCALPCAVEADCAAAGGGEAQDWVCNFVGLEGVCEFAGAAPPTCDPQMCAAGTVALCHPHLGSTTCVPLCESDDDCVAPFGCGGMLEDGSGYCTANEGVGCSSGGCTCLEAADCPTQASVCGPNEG